MINLAGISSSIDKYISDGDVYAEVSYNCKEDTYEIDYSDGRGLVIFRESLFFGGIEGIQSAIKSWRYNEHQDG